MLYSRRMAPIRLDKLHKLLKRQGKILTLMPSNVSPISFVTYNLLATVGAFLFVFTLFYVLFLRMFVNILYKTGGNTYYCL
jgi:hypothetical protein